jgi:hypothetical protein
MRVGAGAEKIANLFNGAEADATTTAALLHADSVNRWWDDVERTAADTQWSNMPLVKRQQVFKYRVAYV